MSKVDLGESNALRKPSGKTRFGFFLFFSGLSIRQRLPLLMAVLLGGVIVASTWASYSGVKESALELGRERLLNLTLQLATLSQQSTAIMLTKSETVANDPAIRAYLSAASSDSRPAALAVLQQFAPQQDPSSMQIELWNANHSLALVLPESSPAEPSDLEKEFKLCADSPYKIVGTIRMIKETIAYPLVAAARDEAGKPIGYLVRWRKLSSTPDARKQLTDLIGSQAALYFGNSQGDVLTDTEKVVSPPPGGLRSTLQVTHYIRDGNSVMALGRPINGTPLFVMIEFPDQGLLAQANRFLRRMILIGIVLFVIGLGGAFALSRSITRPLNLLTGAASAISSGEYSRQVHIGGKDELGKLARAFNTMAVQVRDSQRALEHRVQERTSQLEVANKELESFSYSVSHDLRAPLRAIDGFSRILNEDYAENLPQEAHRYLDLIRSNAKQMGRLVDDLLNFSRLGRQAMQKQSVHPADLARQVLDELQSEQQGRKLNISIGELPVIQADPSLLKQVYVNLLSNSLKYTRVRDEAEIEVGAINANGNGGDTVYYVRDNGAGFDMQYANKLFGVFQRLHRAEDFEGTGVGLAIVQRIVQRHGGRVWAEAEVNKGATFSFTLHGGSAE
jgi:signal transduction histidine kinase